ncbi:MAG: DUF362 domain-containing protein [Desulfovibrio sp.]
MADKSASQVYFWNLRTSRKAPYSMKMKRMLKGLKINDMVKTGQTVALKMHFGEAGNTGFLQPIWLKPFTDFFKKAGGLPFLTDTSTLYVGQRGEAVSHTLLASQHGFDAHVTGAPVIIADGVKGQYELPLPIPNGKHFSEAWIAGDIHHADHLVTMSHFKGHQLAGYGGTIKNIAMGCASRKGKMAQHAITGPKVHESHCTGCGACTKVCQPQALTLGEDNKITLNPELCVGCGACFHTCRTSSLVIDWKTDVSAFMERMIEYTAGVLLNRKTPSLHINFVRNVTPECDCVGYSDAPLCPDVGILASFDPVAVDQACIDMVNDAPPLPNSSLPELYVKGQNKFLAVHPNVPEDMGLAYAEELGLGQRKYRIIPV